MGPSSKKSKAPSHSFEADALKQAGFGSESESESEAEAVPVQEKKRKRSKKAAAAPAEPAPAAEPAEAASAPPPRVRYVNKQRVLVVCSRGTSARHRHLLEDLKKLLPHHKSDAKLDTKNDPRQLNEICELKSCNGCVYLEARKRSDLYMWVSRAPKGPSAKFLVQNVHTMDELRLTGNCGLGTRALLCFDGAFDAQPHWSAVRDLLAVTFGTPRGHPKSKPFFDRAMAFSIADGKVWVRHYQIVDDAVDDADAVVALRRGIFVFATSTQPGDDEPFHRPVLTLSRGGRSAGGAERRRPSGPRRRFVIDKKHAPLSDGSPFRSSTAARPRAPPPCDPASPRRRSATRRPSSRSAPASCSRRSASSAAPSAARRSTTTRPSSSPTRSARARSASSAPSTRSARRPRRRAASTSTRTSSPSRTSRRPSGTTTRYKALASLWRWGTAVALGVVAWIGPYFLVDTRQRDLLCAT